MTITDLIVNKNNNNNNKKIYFLIPVNLCLICTNKCSNSRVIYSECRCNCHNNNNGFKLISDQERELGDTAFAEMCDEHLKNGGDPDFL